MKPTPIALAAALAVRLLRTCTKWSAKRRGIDERRSCGKFCQARFVADDGQFHDAEPERKRHVHFRRERRQRRPGQGQDAR
jgi:hypothetical protein